MVAMHSHASRYRGLLSAAAVVSVFLMEGLAQTRQGMETLGTYIRPGTRSASAGIWGWTSPSGKEFALLTSRDPGGLSFVDISNPAEPKEINFIPSGKSIWHEVHSYKNIAYKISQENSDGLQIIDMAPLDQGNPAVLLKSATDWFTVAHTLYVDTTVTPARLFVAYGRTEGVKIFTLEDPASPKFIHTIPGGGQSHDMFARGNRLYVCNQFTSTLSAYDITTLTAPVELYTIDFDALAKTLGEPPRSISHNAYLSEDGRYLFTTEETVGSTVKAFDITNASRSNPPRLVGRYVATNTIIAHNAYIKGHLMFVAHYTAGIRVVDVSNPAQMKEIAFSRPSTSTAEYGGTWGAYPWFKSGSIIHGDDVLGLHIERLTAASRVAAAAGRQDFRIVDAYRGRVEFTLPRAGSYRLNLYSPAGHELLTLSGEGKAGLQTLSFENGKLRAGKYLIRIGQDGNLASTPLVLGF